MYIKELSISEFTDYSITHPLTSYTQTINYAILLSEYGFEYDLIGFVDDNEHIHAASLILTKNIANFKYGYAPKGFLLDYTDYELLNSFTKKLCEYYYNKKVAFIKVNPPVITANINNKTLESHFNHKALNTKKLLTSIGYTKLKDNLYFEAMQPRFNAIINLNNSSFSKFNKNTRNKIKKSIRKGLIFEKSTSDDIKLLNFKSNDSFFYKDFFNTFSKDGLADFFTIKINRNLYLENSQNTYLNEQENNAKLNEKVIILSSKKNINKKMNSDLSLLAYKKDIMESTKLTEESDDILIGAVLVVKHINTVKIVASYYDSNYKRFLPNYFMHYNLIKVYTDKYDYLDLNGISGDFSSSNYFKGLNDFKLGFNPELYETIGEFDLVIEPKAYKSLLKSGTLTKEFKTKY